MLRIWGRRNSINVQKVMWLVAELGLPHERIEAGMAFGQVGEAWYAAMNPHRLVPVIDDGGVVVWESNAILRYLAAKHAPGRWIGVDPASRAHAEMWMDWQQAALMLGMSPLFLGLIRAPAAERDMVALRKAALLLEKHLRVLDAHLADKTYMLGRDMTVADVALGVVANRWYHLPLPAAEGEALPPRPGLPHLRAWYERLVARPAFAAHVMIPLS